MTYSEKLKHPFWQKKRLEILQRDNWCCQLCSDNNTNLQVHHKVYISGREPWDYENEVLITVCQHCHACIEAIKKYNADYVPLKIEKYIDDKGFNTFFCIVKENDNSALFSIFIFNETSGELEFITAIPPKIFRSLVNYLDLLKQPIQHG